MNVKEFYRRELRKILIHAAIAFFVAAALLGGAMGCSAGQAILLGICYSGVPCGWAISGKILGGWVIVGPLGLIVLVIRLMISLLIGIFALPVKIISCVSKIRSTPDDEYIDVDEA